MSAYVVDREHIAYLINAALWTEERTHSHRFRWYHGGAWQELAAGDIEAAVLTGQMLWNECLASVKFRYPDWEESGLPGPVDEDFIYGSHDIGFRRVTFDPVQIIVSCNCYEYQSCEHPAWEESEAKAFVDRLRTNATRCLPGYDDATWGAPECAYRR